MEEEEQAVAADESTASQTRPKRSRAGCLTCRTRRRKCDEGKPICQNCISKGFECRYAEAYQILGKHNFTPEVVSDVNYTKLKFVSGDGEKEQDEEEQNDVAQSYTTPIARSTVVTFQSPVRQSETMETEMQHSEKTTPQQSGTSAENYEFAVHGLLALGSGMGRLESAEVNYSPRPTTGDRQSIHTDRNEITIDREVPIFERFSAETAIEHQPMQVWQSMGILTSDGSIELPHERVLNLLKYYRYKIAPRLDICDKGQAFGCEALHLSTGSTSIRYGLLALADTCLNNHTGHPSDVAVLADILRQQDHTLDVVSSALLDVLSILRNVNVDLSRFWSEEVDMLTRARLVNRLLPEIGVKSFASSLYWLLVRLQLSVALTDSSTLRITLPPPSTLVASRALFPGETPDEGFQCAHETVALCVDAAMYRQGDEDRWLQQRYGQSRLDIWRMLVEGLEKWFINRPQDFQAIFELYPKDGTQSKDEFPVIVFSSGAAILANQLCHTAMLLLLQNKPRFAGQANRNSSFMSTLWHSHRICGIAINNERQDCWDPCLLASLLVAARMATHESQHSAILRTLESVQELTGWSIAKHLDNLRTEWQQAEAW